jgi:ABC-type nickel/cobalt efflux system permease component RcnA
MSTMAFREEPRRSARVRMVTVAAAAAIVVIGVAIWLVYRGLGPHRNTNVTYQANLLDLRERSALRGAALNLNGAPIELPRGALALSIYLPTGSEPGNTRSKSWSSLASHHKRGRGGRAPGPHRGA